MKIRSLILSAAIGASAFGILPSAQAATDCDVLIFSGRIAADQPALVNAGFAGCLAGADTRVLTPGADSAKVGVLVSASADQPTGGSFTNNGETTTFTFEKNAAGTRWESPVFSLTGGGASATAIVGGSTITVNYAGV